MISPPCPSCSTGCGSLAPSSSPTGAEPALGPAKPGPGDAEGLRTRLLLHGALPVIPAKQNRREPMEHDAVAYRARNRVERCISKLKQFRRVATRHDKTAASFLAFVELAALRVWTRYVHAT